MTTTLHKRPLFQSAASAPFAELLGGGIGVRLRGEDTGGDLALVEQVVPAGYPGPPLHAHPGFDEHFYVLEGTLAFRLGDEAFDGAAGSVVYVPRTTPHTFANRSAARARMLVIVSPAGFERYFDDLLELAGRAGGMPSARALRELNEQHGTVMLGGQET